MVCTMHSMHGYIMHYDSSSIPISMSVGWSVDSNQFQGLQNALKVYSLIIGHYFMHYGMH